LHFLLELVVARPGAYLCKCRLIFEAILNGRAHSLFLSKDQVVFKQRQKQSELVPFAGLVQHNCQAWTMKHDQEETV